MSVKNFRLTGVGTSIQLGKGGSILGAAGTTIQALLADGLTLAPLEAATPDGTNGDEVVTVAYLNTQGALIVSEEFSGAAGPVGTTTGAVAICHTAGLGYVKSELVRYDGTSWVNPFGAQGTLPPDGTIISVTETLGNYPLSDGYLYVFDAASGLFELIGPAASAADPIEYNRAGTLVFGSAATLAIGAITETTAAKVTRVIAKVTELWDDVPTLTIGYTGQLDEFLKDSDISIDDSDTLAAVGDVFIVDQYEDVPGDTQINAYYGAGGGETAGALDIMVMISEPKTV